MEEDNISIHDYLIITKFAMLALGQWPSQSRKQLVILGTFWLVEDLSSAIPTFIAVFRNFDNFDIIVEGLTTGVCAIAIILKFFTGFTKHKKIASLIYRMECDWKTIKDKKELRMLKEHANSGRFFLIVYMVSTTSVMASFMVAPLIAIFLDYLKPSDTSRFQRFPLLADYVIFDHWNYKIATVIHMYITIILAILPLWAMDSLFSTCVHHACGMIAILKHRIKCTKVFEKTVAYHSIHVRTLDNIRLHKSIIRFCDDINDTFSEFFFWIIGVNVVMISCTGMMPLLTWGQWEDMVRYFVFFIAQIMHLFYYSLGGQRLMNESSDILDSLYYETNWYLLPVSIRKLLLFVMMKSRHSITVTCKIFILSLPNFAVVMKSAFSYLTVLNSSMSK